MPADSSPVANWFSTGSIPETHRSRSALRLLMPRLRTTYPHRAGLLDMTRCRPIFTRGRTDGQSIVARRRLRHRPRRVLPEVRPFRGNRTWLARTSTESVRRAGGSRGRGRKAEAGAAHQTAVQGSARRPGIRRRDRVESAPGRIQGFPGRLRLVLQVSRSQIPEVRMQKSESWSAGAQLPLLRKRGSHAAAVHSFLDNIGRASIIGA